MEPFNLSLQQVNFEEKDLGEDDTLHAFSNLVSFDSEFREETAYTVPVGGRNPSPRSINDAFTEEKYSPPYPGGRNEEVPFMTQLHLVNSSYTDSGRQHNDSLAIEPSEDSFMAFRDTVEALALQKSVIGKSTVKPASQEEVLRVIAETQSRLQKTADVHVSTPSETPESEKTKVQQASESKNATNDNTVYMFEQSQTHVQPSSEDFQDGRPQSQTSTMGDLEQDPYIGAFSNDDQVYRASDSPQDFIERMSNASTRSISSSGRLEELESVTSHSDKYGTSKVGNTIIESTSEGGHITKELIQISKKEMEFSVERNAASWFSRKPDKSTEQRVEPKKKHRDFGSQSMSNGEEISPISEKGTSSLTESFNSAFSPTAMLSEDENVSHSSEVHVIGAGNIMCDDVDSKQIHGTLPHLTNSENVVIMDGNSDLQGSVPNYESKALSEKWSPTNSEHRGNSEVSSPKASSQNLKNSPLSPHQSSPDTMIRTPQTSSPSGGVDNHRGFTVDELLRLIAKLEGQIEMLELESSSVLKDRAQLQAQVATLLQQVTALENHQAVLNGDCADLRADKETLRQNQGRLEQVIMDAHKLLLDKDRDLKTLNEDLRLSHEASEKLQEGLKLKNSDILSREATIQDMKGKITELYVDLQMSNQNKLLAESENKSLQGEVKSLALAKEWYQDQLQVSQVAKGQLQKEISSHKSELIGQNTMIERLKNDNLSTKQRLAEAEQRALSEKEKLAHHLEAIEAQMMEREATYLQLQNQKDSIEATLETRLVKSQDDVSGEAAAEMQKVQNDLRRKQATIAMLEHEHAELRKRITLSQESILERDKNIEELGRKLIDLEVEFKEGQLVIQQKSDEAGNLQDEKNGLKVELSALREEKQTISGALNTLKQDMAKVETSFKHMKSELKLKQDELSHFMNDNKQLELELANVRQREQIKLVEERQIMNGPQQNSTTMSDNQLLVDQDDTVEIVSLKENVTTLKGQNAELIKRLEGVRSESSLLITELKSQNAGLETEMNQLRKELVEITSQASVQAEEGKEVVDGHTEVVEDLQRTISSWQSQFTGEAESTRDKVDKNIDSLKISETTIEKLLEYKLIKSEIHVIISQLLTVNQRLVSSYNDLRLSTAIEADDSQVIPSQEITAEPTPETEHLLGAPSAAEKQLIESNLAQLDSLKAENDELQCTITELEVQISTLSAEKLAMGQHLAALEKSDEGPLVQENDRLRSKVASLETDSHREIAKQKAKALKLGKDLQAALKMQHQQQHTFESSTVALESQLQTAEADRSRLEDELKAAQARFSLDLDEKTTQLHSDLQEVQEELSTVSRQRDSAEQELRSVVQRLDSDTQLYKNRIFQLETELQQLDSQLGEQREQSMNYQQLMMDLERERGRLTGLLQNHSALKEHTSTLEMALAQRESSVLDVSTQIQERLQKKEKQYLELSELLEEHRQTLEAEKQNSFDMKKELLTEKSNHVQVRRQLETLWMEHDQLKSEVELQRQEVTSLNEQLAKAHDSDRKHRAELERMSHDLRVAIADRDGYLLEVQGQRAKDPVVLEQLKTLEWQVNEKTTEVAALQDQLNVAQERQQMELGMLRKSLQNLTSEVSSLREELLNAKQEKTSLQTRIAELKGALKSSIQHTKLLQKDSDKSDGEAMTFDLTALENLLLDATTPSTVSKPLSFLQATLSSLRGEISSLQNQVDEHASAVETSSKAWREVELQVKDLRAVCKSSAADRAASQKLIEETYAVASETLTTANTEISGDS